MKILDHVLNDCLQISSKRKVFFEPGRVNGFPLQEGLQHPVEKLKWEANLDV